MHVSGQNEKKALIYLKPGETCFSNRPTVVTTVLGSCISATFFHRATGSASICHAMQPRCPRRAQCPAACNVQPRYAVCAITDMIRQMMGRGMRPKDIEVKLFGGAALMGGAPAGATKASMGQQNVQAALETISNGGLILKVADVGGALGRKIIFDTATGAVLLKRLRRTNPMNLIA